MPLLAKLLTCGVKGLCLAFLDLPAIDRVENASDDVDVGCLKALAVVPLQFRVSAPQY